MNVEELDRLLGDVFLVDPKNTEHFVFGIHDLTVLKVRDVLMEIGHIKQENLERQEYVATMGAGFCKSNIAYLATRIEENKLYVSVNAREGLINQHTRKGAINELRRKLKEYIEE